MKIISTMYRKCQEILPDKLYLSLWYYRHMHEFPKFRHPKSFGDYIQWMKVYGKLERYAQYADKYTVRSYIEQKIGTRYLIPLLGTWEHFDDIPFDRLPKKFVLKATHGCGYNFICKDKSTIDYEALKQQVESWFAEDFYYQEREPQYHNYTPRIIVEKYLEDETGQLTDYKIYCSKGEPKIIQVNRDRFSGNMSDELLDTTWRRFKDIRPSTYSMPKKLMEKPAELEQLLNTARKLSQEFPFVRVDLYVVKGRIYFGELTFTPGSGLVTFKPKETGSQAFVRQLDIDLKAYAI